jgi:hypothetical protein
MTTGDWTAAAILTFTNIAIPLIYIGWRLGQISIEARRIADQLAKPSTISDAVESIRRSLYEIRDTNRGGL